MEANYRLKSVGVDAGDLADDSHFDVLRVLLRDGHVARRVVLLVGHQYVAD